MQRARGTRIGFLALSALLLAAEVLSAADGTVLLTEKHIWRKHYTFIPPAFADGAPAGRPGDGIHTIFTAVPPAVWTHVVFDDTSWLMGRAGEFEGVGVGPRIEQSIGKNAGEVYLRASHPFFVPVGLVCQRSRFVVPDRRRIGKITLTLTCRGGFIAYVNGREVGRGHLGEGAVAPDAPAEAYPPEAFFTRDSLQKGKPRGLQPNDFRSNQWTLRERTSGAIEIPADVLRDGVNVLALELHRGAYPVECRKHGTPCATVGLSVLELSAEGKAVTAGKTTPEVFAVELTRTLFDPALSRLNESTGPLRIVAARNGTFSGQAIVTTAPGETLRKVTARISPLRRVGGKEMIPAEAIRIRYAAVNPFWPKALDDLGLVQPWRWRRDAGAFGGTRFDVLLDAAPTDAESVPVWITVKTPRDAAAGDYAGQLTIDADGTRHKVPVDLHLADWTLPDVKDHAGLINLYQSPETLASYYKVKPWSEEHWRLIDRSMQLMAEMGNVGIFIPLLAESQMGNAESMVMWTRKADGTYDDDFSIVDRYVDTALRHHDRLRFVALN
ncbi:MAG TPA: glycoside hydrolase domain-containing protein, partial [Planctomycetota bacterium]|nr:glycoside hydrolase domain-containing protein [Planctomycetota bacterium]